MKVTLDLNLRVVVRWVLAILLIAAALSKIANPQEFYGSLLGYRLPLPSILVQGVAIVLPWLELICGLLLLFRLHVQPALAWAVCLFLVFTVATGQAWARGLNISCGCMNLSMFGINGAGGLAKFLESPGFACIKALVLLAAGVWLFRQPEGSK